MSCPTEISYSYLWAGYETAYCTDQFDFSGSLLMRLVFLNKSGGTLSLSTPQVWTTTSLPPEPAEETERPAFQLMNTPQEVHPGEKFVIEGIVDLSLVKTGNKYLAFRPQTPDGSWFDDVGTRAPVVSASFICLPEKETTKTITSGIV